MASLLVFVDAERLRELLPEYAADTIYVSRGDTWLIAANTFSQPQLERLDEQSWLFIVSGNSQTTRCIAVLRHPRLEGGKFAGGSAEVMNRDITHLLPRLGCTGGPAGVATWAAIPRVVPPSDLDLLMYELNLADDDEEVAPVLPDDPRTIELRSAVWDDPISDDARLIYADYLQDRGDPRGELISLQVLRVRAGDHVSDRERQLVRRISRDIAEPLTPYLAPNFEVQRGFVTRCAVNDTPMPKEITWHVAWRTVEDLTATNFELLTSPHVRAKRVGVTGHQLRHLVDHVRPLPFETVVGIAPVGKIQRGVWIEDGNWETVTSVGALTEVRTLSVNAFGAPIPALMRSALGNRLLHFDTYLDLDTTNIAGWRESFDTARTPLFTMRFSPVDERRQRQYINPEVLVALRRTTRTPHLIVQLDEALSVESVTVLMRFIAQVSRNIQQVEVHDFEPAQSRLAQVSAVARGGKPIPEKHAVLLERINAMFPHVLVQPTSAKPLTP